MKRIFFLALVLFSLSGSVGAAATPEYFITRGRIVNKELQSIPGTYEIRASLWNDADAPEEDVPLLNKKTENEALWKEYHIVQIMKDGKFELHIGSELGLPSPFKFNKYEYLQLEVRKEGQKEFQLLDPLPFHGHIDRITLASLPFKEKEKGNNDPVVIDEETGTAVTLGNSAGNVPVLNKYGELADSVIPVSVRTKLTSLQENVLEVSDHAQENTEDIKNLRNDVVAMEKEWEKKWNTAFNEENDETVSLITNLNSRTNTLERDVKVLQHRENVLYERVSALPELIEKSVQDITKDTFVTKEELADIELQHEDSSWKKVLVAGDQLESVENSSIGDVQFIVDEKKLVAFDGNEWKRLADQDDISKTLEKTVQKTFYYHNEIVAIDQNKTAQAGLFYWDKDKSTYFVGMADGSLRSLFAAAQLPEPTEEPGRDTPPVADWVDLRTIDPNSITIQIGKDTLFEQDSEYGIKIKSSKKRANSSIALPDFVFDRYQNKTYEAVFYTGNMNGQILLGLMDGETPPPYKSLGKDVEHTEIGLYMYLREDSNLFYGQNENGTSWYEIFEQIETWEPNTYYRMSLKVQDTDELTTLINIAEVSKDDFNTPIKTIVNHESQFSGLSETLKPYLFGTGTPDYSFVAFRTY
jgi:hypothetical protein